MANELQPFEYGEVDAEIADNLKRYAEAINADVKTVSDATFDIGKNLKAAREDLSHDRTGNGFLRWCESKLGMKRTTVENILNYHTFISQQLGNKEVLEALPKRLVYEAARPSTPQELKDGVAHGDITTLAEFRDMKARLSAAQDAAARSDAARGAAVEAAEEAQGKAENLAQLLAAEQKDGADARRQCEQLTRMATSLRATIEKQAQELANRPNVETVVVPEDYVALQNENARMKADLAKYEAHARGVSVQELSECEERFRDQQKTREDEREAWKKVDKLLSAIYLFPTANTAEIKELARCFIKESPYREQAVERANKTIERGLKVLQVLGEALGYGQRLTLVK